MLPDMSIGKLITEGCGFKALHVHLYGHNLLTFINRLKSYLTLQFRLTIFPVFRCCSLVSF